MSKLKRTRFRIVLAGNLGAKSLLSRRFFLDDACYHSRIALVVQLYLMNLQNKIIIAVFIFASICFSSLHLQIIFRGDSQATIDTEGSEAI